MKDDKKVSFDSLLFIFSNILAIIMCLFFLGFLFFSMFSGTEFIPPFPCFSIICVLSCLLYKLLAPLHELGHFYAAQHFNKQVTLYLYCSHIYCSDWSVYSPKQSKAILLCGALSKILYCLILSFICYFTNHCSLTYLFIFTAIFEYIFNLSSIFPNSKKQGKENDFYQMFNYNTFINDKKADDDYSDCQNNFICDKYPVILLTFTIVFIIIL